VDLAGWFFAFGYLIVMCGVFVMLIRALSRH
jgi:hypothetical protein